MMAPQRCGRWSRGAELDGDVTPELFDLELLVHDRDFLGLFSFVARYGVFRQPNSEFAWEAIGECARLLKADVVGRERTAVLRVDPLVDGGWLGSSVSTLLNPDLLGGAAALREQVIGVAGVLVGDAGRGAALQDTDLVLFAGDRGLPFISAADLDLPVVRRASGFARCAGFRTTGGNPVPKLADLVFLAGLGRLPVAAIVADIDGRVRIHAPGLARVAEALKRGISDHAGLVVCGAVLVCDPSIVVGANQNLSIADRTLQIAWLSILAAFARLRTDVAAGDEKERKRARVQGEDKK